jgi:hypothetical protein
VERATAAVNGVDAEGVARRHENRVEAGLVGGAHDRAAVLEAAHQRRVGHPELLVVVVAESGEPGQFERLGRHRPYAIQP